MKSTLMFVGAAASAVLFVSAGSASAGTLTATFKNMSSDEQSVTTSNYNVSYPDSPISAGDTGYGAHQNTSSNPNLTANATYQGTTTRLGCFFTAQAVYNSQRKRYTFSSNAQSRGASGGTTATCTSQITSSNSTTGDFSVTYTISGF